MVKSLVHCASHFNLSHSDLGPEHSGFIVLQKNSYYYYQDSNDTSLILSVVAYQKHYPEKVSACMTNSLMSVVFTEV